MGIYLSELQEFITGQQFITDQYTVENIRNFLRTSEEILGCVGEQKSLSGVAPFTMTIPSKAYPGQKMEITTRILVASDYQCSDNLPCDGIAEHFFKHYLKEYVVSFKQAYKDFMTQVLLSHLQYIEKSVGVDIDKDKDAAEIKRKDVVQKMFASHFSNPVLGDPTILIHPSDHNGVLYSSSGYFYVCANSRPIERVYDQYEDFVTPMLKYDSPDILHYPEHIFTRLGSLFDVMWYIMKYGLTDYPEYQKTVHDFYDNISHEGLKRQMYSI